MIKELKDLGEKLSNDESADKYTDDAIKYEKIGIHIEIDSRGNFIKYSCFDEIDTPCEAITAKKGNARLLVDKAEETLGYFSQDDKDGENKSAYKHQLYLKKLEYYKQLSSLAPVNSFFYKNSKNGVENARAHFEDGVHENVRIKNLTFLLVEGKTIKRINEESDVINALIENYKEFTKSNLSGKICSVCGKADYPVLDQPHGMIKRVPDGQSAGCALISFNENAYESYGFVGNNNSSVCTHCATLYVKALNFLLNDGSKVQREGDKKPHYEYTHRQNLGSDTAAVFWTRDNHAVDMMSWLNEPEEAEVKSLLSSPSAGKDILAQSIDDDRFYCITLSGSAARIAVRDWIETSLGELKRNIARWFEDIRIAGYDFKTEQSDILYFPLWKIAKSCQGPGDDTTASRVETALWKAAIKNEPIPIRVLTSALHRIRVEERKDTTECAALIKLVLNRNNKKGEKQMKEVLDLENHNIGYLCGRVFAVLENVQFHAIGEANAGIGNKLFGAASTTPSATFGRLMKLSKHHLGKIHGEKAGLAVNLDKSLQEIMSHIDDFPKTLSLEDQGRFALGYYHQKNAIFSQTDNKAGGIK
jgi:CRISPR-associated protein Csd1